MYRKASSVANDRDSTSGRKGHCKDTALASKNGPGKVVNGGEGTTVTVNDTEKTLEVVTNPVEEEPHKKETEPYEGIDELGKVFHLQ